MASGTLVSTGIANPDHLIHLALDPECSARERAKAAAELARTRPRDGSGPGEQDGERARRACAWLLDRDPSPLVRKAAVPGVGDSKLLRRRLAVDPSWVVRTAALRALPPDANLDDLRPVANDPHWRVRSALIDRLAARKLSPDWRDTPLEAGLSDYLRWTFEGGSSPPPPLAPPPERPPWWDPDPAVLLARLRRTNRSDWMAQLPVLLRHGAEAVRRWAVNKLLDFGDAELCARAVAGARDPRHPSWTAAEDLVARIDPTRRPPWTPVRPLVDGPPPRPAAPGVRPSLEPKPPGPAPAPVHELGPDADHGLRLAVSGHYHLPAEAYATACEAGVRDVFWEPNYHTFNRFMRGLSAADRARLRVITGTFGAEPGAIRKDVERALRKLGIERLAVFLLFWVRSEARVTDEVAATLEALKAEGKVARTGLSTHRRDLAARYLADAEWDPVMLRHNLAHRRAEDSVFPMARERGRTVITFNATCYGRLIQAGASARDCLRYSLRDPAVGLVLTAPATAEQLRENLSAATSPPPTEPEIDRLRAIGDRVYRRNKAFETWVRSR